jgi:hypothetical protein
LTVGLYLVETTDVTEILLGKGVEIVAELLIEEGVAALLVLVVERIALVEVVDVEVAVHIAVAGSC